MTTAKDACSGDYNFESPATRAFSITPDDNNDLSYVTRGIFTGSGGTLVCQLIGDTVAVTFANIPAGIILPLRVIRVMAGGTTASMGLVGLY